MVVVVIVLMMMNVLMNKKLLLLLLIMMIMILMMLVIFLLRIIFYLLMILLLMMILLLKSLLDYHNSQSSHLQNTIAANKTCAWRMIKYWWCSVGVLMYHVLITGVPWSLTSYINKIIHSFDISLILIFSNDLGMLINKMTSKPRKLSLL